MRFNYRLLPVLIIMLVAFQILSPSKIWVASLVMVGGGWLITYLWARSLLHNLMLAREMRFGWAQVGDNLQERFTLVNRGLLPALWVDIIDHSTLPGSSGDRARSIDPLSLQRWHVERKCTRRGLYMLGPTEMRAGDPLGVYTVSFTYPDSTALLVVPPVVPLPAIQVSPGGQAGEGRRSLPNPFERTVNASGVREYTPGDNLNSIHWPTTARRGEFFVRLFDSTPASDWWIFLDMQASVQAGQDEDSTQEHAVVLAASLADQGMRMGRSVGLVACGRELVWQAPRPGTDQRMSLLRKLALLDMGDTPLVNLLQRERPRFQRGASLIIITPNMQGDWVQGLVPLMRVGLVPTVLLMDVLTFGGTGDPAPIETILSGLGVRHYRITHDLLDRPEARPGRQGQIEWRVLGTGRVLPLRPLDEESWRGLGGKAPLHATDQGG